MGKAQKIKTTTYKFPVIIEKDEDGFFVASVPALPGCSTQAKTIEKLIILVKDAIRLCLSMAKDDPEYAKKVELLSCEPIFIGMDMVRI